MVSGAGRGHAGGQPANRMLPKIRATDLAPSGRQPLPGPPLRGTIAARQWSPNPAKRKPAIPANAIVPRPPMTHAMQTAIRLACSALAAFWRT